MRTALSLLGVCRIAGRAAPGLLGVSLLLTAFLTATTAAAQELDRVVLRNGNIIDGEVLSLRRGDLEVDTDAMDVVLIDWDDIASVTSGVRFEVTDVTGGQYYGALRAGESDGVLVVGAGADSVALPFEVVVEMRSLADGFLAKTKGYVDLGTNMARANRLRSVLFNGHFSYDGLIWEIDVDAESYFQSQTTVSEQAGTLEERTSRNSIGVAGRRFFDATWAVTTAIEGEQNEELNLDRRVLLSLGVRYQIVRTRGFDVHAGASGVFNGERFSGEESNGSGEVNLIAGFDMFDVSDLDIYTEFKGYVSPSDGRYRVNIDARISWEIVDDFFIGFNGIERYDSSPGGDASGRDFQYGFTVGWSWG